MEVCSDDEERTTETMMNITKGIVGGADPSPKYDNGDRVESSLYTRG
jgi:hypothetical protein